MGQPSYSFMEELGVKLFKLGLNPYIAFILLVLLVFSLYFLIYYHGNIKLLLKHYKDLSLRKKRDFWIFIVGGLLISFVFLYLGLDDEYRSVYIDNRTTTFGGNLVTFLENIGLVK